MLNRGCGLLVFETARYLIVARIFRPNLRSIIFAIFKNLTVIPMSWMCSKIQQLAETLVRTQVQGPNWVGIPHLVWIILVIAQNPQSEFFGIA